MASSRPASRAAGRFLGWRVLALASITSALSGPGQTIGVSVFIDHVVADLDLSRSVVSSGYLVGTLVGATALPVVGRQIDRFGVRRAMAVIAAAFSLALVAMAGVQGIVTLTAGFVGIRMLGQGSLFLTSTVAVQLWFERRRGFAIGVLATVSSALMALVPVGLDMVIDAAGWRVAWLVAAAVVAGVVVPIAVFGIVDRPADVGQLPDGDDPTDADEPADGDDPTEGVEPTNGSGAEGDGRARAGPSVPSLTRAEAVRTVPFWVLAIVAALSAMFVTALNFHQISLLGQAGLSSTAAAALFLPQMIGSTVVAVGLGALSDRFGRRGLPATAMVLLASTLLVGANVSPGPVVVAYAMLIGATTGAMRTTSGTLMPAWFGVAHLGSIQGSLTLVLVVGSSVGPVALALGERWLGGYDAALLAAVVVPVVAAWFAWSGAARAPRGR